MDARQLMHEGIERWNAHDREGFLAHWAEDAVFVDEPNELEIVGRDKIGEGFYDMWNVAYPDNHLEIESIVVDGSVVCFEGRFIGTSTGVFKTPEFEMPPTGKRIDVPFVFVSESRDGKTVRARHYYDRLLALEQEEVLTVEKLFAQLAPA